MKQTIVVKFFFIPVILLFCLILSSYWKANVQSSWFLFRGYNNLKEGIAEVKIIENDFVKSLSLFKYRSRAYFYLSYLYLREFRYGEGLRIFESGLELNVDPAYFYNYSVLLKRMNKHERYRKIMARSQELFPLYLKNYRFSLENESSPEKNRIDYRKRALRIWGLRKINGELDTPLNKDIMNWITGKV